MPVLQKTIDYLLDLLDQPYNENFLGVYNFLWDRMRAIRMDLRMQHIFNRGAILMLEQMIRLHVVAMHELCEYKKGEGFSDGFDAHLNIEQMNKTSVELFQMYEDHRKKGNTVPTEKEFRGYYALLKLDKHPGYKVEPAELSLDLAKMAPEMRCTPEILFARDVARACRIGNYIAFFRLASKATYLQACLMHAHFAKLRTQALASLHSGLQHNQGIPISHVVKWLGMEGEDIESLLEYHGFSLRRYEEVYMVKEGPFLNSDLDFPTKCSELVHKKKSRRIADDVKSAQALSDFTEEKETVSDLVDMVNQTSETLKTDAWVNVVEEEEMLDSKVASSPKAATQARQLLEESPAAVWNRENDGEMTEVSVVENTCISEDDSLSDYEEHVENGLEVVGPAGVFMDKIDLPKLEGRMVQAGVPRSSNFNCIVDPSLQRDVRRRLENEALIQNDEIVRARKKDEAVREKLKRILRKWKQRSALQREIREKRVFLANAALTSLSLGPPIRLLSEAKLSRPNRKLNIDYVAKERHGRRGKSWSTLNVSELTAPILSARNPDYKCICWKLAVFVQGNDPENKTYNLAMRWLQAKLMGTGKEMKETDDELVVSLPHLSIWKKWTGTQMGPPQTCCLSVIRQVILDDDGPFREDNLIAGTSCFVFLVSESISWEIQKFRLHEILKSMPSGFSLPLLIVSSDSYKEDIADPSFTIINRLGLDELCKTKINSYSVVFVGGIIRPDYADGFFNNDQLTEGLQWLANRSPLQPRLSLVNTRDLVLNYLRFSMEGLDNLKASEVGPDHYVSVFNEALDHSAQDIITAASANSNHWPSPEIDLLEKSSEERIIAEAYLPPISWSSASRIEPLVRAIRGCKLPSFHNDMSWLNKGSSTIRQIQYQKMAIEECLISYLTQSTQLLNTDLAAREASVMLQKGAGLELHGSCHHIVVRWASVFRRIYNWRLLRLSDKKFSDAYILVLVDAVDTGKKDLENNFSLEGHQPLDTVQTQLSLDELIEVSCSVPLAEQPLSVPRLWCSSAPEVIHEGGFVYKTNISHTEENNTDLRCRDFDGDVTLPVDKSSKQKEGPVPVKEHSRLTVLLDQCNRLQDMIGRKLSVYF